MWILESILQSAIMIEFSTSHRFMVEPFPTLTYGPILAEGPMWQFSPIITGPLTKSSSENNQDHEKTNHCTNNYQKISNYEEKRVNDYLIKNGISTTLDISTTLNLYVYDAIRILQKLESKGMVLKAKQS